MRIVQLCFVSTLAFLMVSCGNDTKKSEAEPEVVSVDMTKQEKETAAPTEISFKDPKVAAVYEQYIKVKTALVNTDAATTATHAAELMTALANVGVDEELLSAAQTISETEDVEVQRTSFVIVTAGVEKMLEGAIASGVVYKQYCPMAFDFEGAYWLSNSSEIRNPYFGDKMLKCGTVKAEIK